MANHKNSTKEDEIVLMRGDKPIDFELTNLIKVISMLDKHGKLEAFTRYAKKNNLKVLLPKDSVNYTKQFVAKDALLCTDPIGKKIIRPKTTKPATLQISERGVSGKPRDVYNDCCGF
jgi:hypothetical protein